VRSIRFQTEGRAGQGLSLRRVAAIALGMAIVLALAAAPPDGDGDDVVTVQTQGLEFVRDAMIADSQRRAYEDLGKQIDEAAQGIASHPHSQVGVTGKVWQKLERSLADYPYEPKRSPAERRTKAVDALSKQAADQLARAGDAWITVAKWTDRPEKEANLHPEEAGAEGRTGWRLDRVFGEHYWWLPLAGLGAMAVGLMLVAVDQRQVIRHWWRSRGMGAAAILLPLLLAWPGCGPEEPTLTNKAGKEGSGVHPLADDPSQVRSARLEAWRAAARNRAEQAKDRAKQAEAEVKKKAREAARLRLQAMLPRPDAPESFDTTAIKYSGSAEHWFDQLLAAEAGPQAKLIEALGAARATSDLASDAAKGLDELNDDPKRKEKTSVWQSELPVRAARLAFIVATLAVAWIPLRFVRKRRRRRRQLAARECPRCAAYGTLSPVDRGLVDRHGRSILQQFCAVCQYEFEASYARYERLSIPTVGVPSSGKTRWKLTFYDQINKHQLPRGTTLRVVPSPNNALIDQEVEAAIMYGQRPSPTQPGELSAPLVFYHQDRGRLLGASELLLDLFDFSGEMLFQQAAYQDHVRRRAHSCKSFLVFLDPTNPNYTAQIGEIRRFLGELRRFRAIPNQRKIDVPVAVCITKIDLLVNYGMGEYAARTFVAELRGTADDPMSLKTIRDRSVRCERVLGQMFPNANLSFLLREELGNRVMFFPLSPISIEDQDLGNDDLTQRTLIPFGVLEPIFWLMHMNGFCVLE
jgi:hypothetical protein